MNPNLNWNRERWRTRDRLLKYIIDKLPPCPENTEIEIIFPIIENTNTDEMGEL